MKSRKNEVDTVEKTKVGEEDLKRIKEYIESVRFGTVTVIVQDGKCEAGNCTCKTVCLRNCKKNQEGIRECVNYLGFVQKSLWPSTNI